MRQRLQPSTVEVVHGGRSIGAGAAWDAHRVVTNAHVAASDPLDPVTADGGRSRARVERRDGRCGVARWIRADVRLAPGHSGGPLAEVAGRVLGIDTMVARGLALAVPVSAVQRFLQPCPRPRPGVAMRPVVVRERASARLGLVVVDVQLDGAAKRARTQPGDVILAVDGYALRAPWDLSDALARAASWEVTLVLRNGRRMQFRVQVQPPEPKAA